LFTLCLFPFGIHYVHCAICTKTKKNYRTSSEVHKAITVGGTVLKSILILHLADVGTVPISSWCEDKKKGKYLSINTRKITPELIKLRMYVGVLYAGPSETILPLPQSSPLLFLIHCTRL
jgi:hypothetical protein